MILIISNNFQRFSLVQWFFKSTKSWSMKKFILYSLTNTTVHAQLVKQLIGLVRKFCLEWNFQKNLWFFGLILEGLWISEEVWIWKLLRSSDGTLKLFSNRWFTSSMSFSRAFCLGVSWIFEGENFSFWK